MRELTWLWLSPTQPEGQEWYYCFCQRHLFVRNWFPDSHSWTKPHRIFPFGTMIDPIKTLLGIVLQLPLPIFDLVITNICHWNWFPVSNSGTRTATILIFLHNDRSYHNLIWHICDLVITYLLSLELLLASWYLAHDILSTPDLELFTNLLYLGHDLLYVSHIVFWSSIPEWNQPDYTRSSQITIIGQGDIVSVNYLFKWIDHDAVIPIAICKCWVCIYFYIHTWYMIINVGRVFTSTFIHGMW